MANLPKGIYYDNRNKLCIKFSYKGKAFFKRRDLNGDSFVSVKHALEARSAFLAYLSMNANPQLKTKKAAAPQLTFLQACSFYLKHCKEMFRETTFYPFQKTFNKHIKAVLKIDQLENITQSHLDSWRKAIDLQDYSASYKNKLLRYLVKFFDYINDYFDCNIKYARRINYFRDDSPMALKKHIVYNIPELTQLINRLTSPIARTYFCVNFFTGLRPGEMRALTVRDFNQELMSLHIYKTASTKLGIGKTKIFTTKNRNSIRTVFLPNSIGKVLKKYLEKDHPDNGPESYIFYSPNDGPTKPVSENFLIYSLKAATEKAKLPHITLYEFRHSFATLGSNIESGNLTRVSKALGHKSITTTSTFYDHSGERSLKEFSDKLDELVPDDIKIKKV